MRHQALEPPDKRRGDLDWQQEEQLAKARNKVEAVHEVLEAPKEPKVVEVGDDEDKNGAHEDDDEEEEEEDDDYVDDVKRREGGDASNQAGEVPDSHHLPPQDKSLVFRGPQNERQEAVVAAIKHAWDGYKAHAWGHDHLRPISKSAQNWFGLGLTIVDSLDTLLIAGLKDEFEEAKQWVAESLDFSDKDKDVNLFETTIRVLGGLLSAHHLSGERVFLDKAKDLGDRLMGAFSSPSGVPYSDVNLRSTRGHAPKWSPDSSTSEVSTIQLEFRDLSRATGEPGYEEAAERVSKIIHDQPKSDGLVPIFINANTGEKYLNLK